MNILVLGSRGQLGTELQELHQGYPYKFTFTSKDELDICSTSALTKYLLQHPTDIMINCAAYTQVDKAEANPSRADDINFRSVATLAQVADRYNIHLIHISTDYVFDGMASTPYTEQTPPLPINIYGRSKYLGEQAILSSGCKYTIIRTSWLYSQYGNNFVKTMLRLQNERSMLHVVHDQIGSPTYAQDLALCILTLIKYNHLKTSEIYHYSNEGACSWHEFAIAIAELSGSNCQIVPCRSSEYPTLALRPSYSVLDKEKIKAILPYPIPHWRTSLKKCLSRLLNS